MNIPTASVVDLLTDFRDIVALVEKDRLNCTCDHRLLSHRFQKLKLGRKCFRPRGDVPRFSKEFKNFLFSLILNSIKPQMRLYQFESELNSKLLLCVFTQLRIDERKIKPPLNIKLGFNFL